MRLSLPLTFYEWKHFFRKPSFYTKNKTRRHFSFTKQTETATPLPTSSFTPYSYHHHSLNKSKDPAENARKQHSSARNTQGEHMSSFNGPSFYQLDELKLAETTSQWEIATLQEMMTGTVTTSTPDNSTRPIKSKLEALALQRQILKSCHLQEMADQAHLETLHIYQVQGRPFDWISLKKCDAVFENGN